MTNPAQTHTTPNPPDTRGRILDAALACFLEAGYEQTTVARIRERSGVSNGTLFHRFATKEAIADALYVESMASFQDGLWRMLARRPRSLRAAVRGTIAHQAEWIEANVDRARFVYTRGTLDVDSPGSAELEEMNRKLAAAYQAWLAPLIERGRVRPMSMLVLGAIVTGPTHSIARRWLAGRVATPLHAYVDELTDAACAALSGTPARARHAAPPLARHGRIRLELVSDDGELIGGGEATAEIVAVATARPRATGMSPVGADKQRG
jgi:AcrR family transcriptional regulator